MNHHIKQLLILIGCAVAAASLSGKETRILETLVPNALELTQQFDQIPAERKTQLEEVAQAVRSKVQAGEDAQLTFICTHNSRRSHLSQTWAQTAAAFYGIEGVKTFSGGTQSTACNYRTVRAMRRAGFSIANSTPGEDNPKYLIQYAEKRAPIIAFSKVYHQAGNPSDGFIAIMTCSDADVRCPNVEGCTHRIAIPYIDPKVSDGTEKEDATYDERCEQIGREMFYMMSKV